MSLPPLTSRIAITQIEDDIFESGANPMRNGHVFGGTTMAGSVAAAQATVDDHLNIHSYHAYFLRPGRSSEPIRYEVDRVRDGRSFCTRRVLAKQADEVIFITSMSFQITERGLSHQIEMGKVSGPEGLMNTEELEVFMPKEKMWKHRNDPVFTPFERRHNLKDGNPFGGVWLRYKDAEITDDNQHIQLLSYISDYALLFAAMAKHPEFASPKNIKNIASVDHAMWIHDPDLKVDDWIYYQIDSPWMGNARALTRGSFFNQDGRLIASAQQEGLIRMEPEVFEA